MSVQKQVLLNLPVGGDVTTANGVHSIRGLPPIPTDEFVSPATENVAVTEVVKVQRIGTGTVLPVIVASRLYALAVGNPREVSEGFARKLTPIKAVAAATLSGDAKIDRSNIYRALASSINSKSFLSMTAFEIVDLAYDAQTVNFTVGATLTGGTSGATALILADVDAGVTGVLTLALIGPTTFIDFTDNEAITDGSGGAAVADNATEYDRGDGLHIVDDAGYFPARPNPRLGENTVIITSGFDASLDFTVVTAAVIAEGQGADILARRMILNSTDNNFIAASEYGTPDTPDVPVAGNTYSAFVLEVNKKFSSEAKLGDATSGSKRIQYIVFAFDGAAGFGAFRTAILAL